MWRLRRLLFAPNVLAQLDQAPSAVGLVGSFKHFGDRFIELLPNLLAALVFLALTVVLARLVRRGVEAGLRRTSTEAYVHLLVGKIAYFGTLLLGVVVALSIGGVNLGWVVGSLGLVTVALGLALQDILGNFVAGIVLLLVEDLDDEKIELLLWFWVDPRRHPELQRVRSEVLEATQAVLARSNMGLTASQTGSSASDDKKAG